MQAVIESNRHITVREIAKQLTIYIKNHIRHLGLVKKLDIWVPDELKEIHLTQRINVCDTHFKHNAIDPFWKRILFLKLTMKTGSSTITSIEKDHGPIHPIMNQHKPYQKLSCIKKRSYCQFGGITKVLYILTFQTTDRSTQMFTAKNL